MRQLRYVVADVFTDVPLAGNPVAVFTDARDLDPLTMQALAKETNLSETVFVLPPQAEDADVRIRIFTPANELPFAGHPTLGSAFVLGGPLQKVVIRIETGAGVVPVELIREGAALRFGWMDQPVSTYEPFAEPEALFAAARGRRLGAAGRAVPPRADERLRRARSLRRRSRPSGRTSARSRTSRRAGANTFAREGDRWKTRMFAPMHGVNEDPATGSAAGPLAIHLARHGRIEFGEEIEISQGVEIGRPSKLYASVEGSPDSIERVRVGGSAVLVARGEFRIP